MRFGGKVYGITVGWADIELRWNWVLITFLREGVFVEGHTWSFHRTWDGLVTVAANVLHTDPDMPWNARRGGSRSFA